MTKADIVTKISRTTQVDESLVSPIVESFMATVKDSLANNENVYLREFGSFVVKHRAQKVGRNIAQKTKVLFRLKMFRYSNPQILLRRGL